MHWLAWLMVAGVGLSAALAGLLVSRLMAAVPEEDRSYRDRPPRLLRAAWWPIQGAAFYLGPFLPAAYRIAVQQRLRAAGLGYALAPEQWLAAQVVAGATAFGGMAFLDSRLGQPFSWVGMAAAALAAGVLPAVWLGDRIRERGRQTLKALPFYLDLLTLCVEAGLNLNGALQHAVGKGPPGVLRDELERVLRDVRAGRPRAEALRALAERMREPSVAHLATALIQAERTGMQLGPVLRALADQQRIERFARAEKAAMEAPVKLLFPLLFCIFPCVFLIIGFPLAVKFLHLAG